MAKAEQARKNYASDESLRKCVRHLYETLFQVPPALTRILLRKYEGWCKFSMMHSAMPLTKSKQAFKRITDQWPGQEAAAIDDHLIQLTKASGALGDCLEAVRDRTMVNTNTNAARGLLESQAVRRTANDTRATVKDMHQSVQLHRQEDAFNFAHVKSQIGQVQSQGQDFKLEMQQLRQEVRDGLSRVRQAPMGPLAAEIQSCVYVIVQEKLYVERIYEQGEWLILERHVSGLVSGSLL